MSSARSFIRPLRLLRLSAARQCPQLPRQSAARPARFSTTPRPRRDPAEDPDFVSLVDQAPQLVRSGKKNPVGLFFLALIPITAFALGTWQVQRLGWKTDLIAKSEDRLVRTPMPLPPHIDPSAVPDFDYRRVTASGHFRHDREMLVGPRMREGEQGFEVYTPLEREGEGTTILVNRGWIAKKFQDQRTRPDSLVKGEVRVEGLLREPYKKNMFTPDNRIDKWEFYFPDIKQMAGLAGSQAIVVEATLVPEYLEMLDLQARGVPIGKPPIVNLRNNHAQYIFTWYGLAVATSIMLYMVAKKPASDITRRVRQSRNW